MPYVLYGIILIALIILVRNIRIVPQAQAYVITRLGAYKTTWGVGLHLKIPFIEAVAKRLSLKEQVADFPPQPVITKDNVTMQIDTVVYYQITDPKLYTYVIAARFFMLFIHMRSLFLIRYIDAETRFFGYYFTLII